jgi:putative flippase GtrA
MGRYAFLVFVCIGAFSSLVNLVARIIFGYYSSYEASIILAFTVALATAFILNRLLIFKGVNGHVSEQFFKFLIVNLIALVQIFLVAQMFAYYILPAIGWNWHSETVAHAIGLVSPLLTSYWVHKFWTFKGTADARVAS